MRDGGSYGLTLVFVAISGIGVAAYHPESARLARMASQGSHISMAWFSTGGNIRFALAPVMVGAIVGILADHTSLQVALAPLVVMPILSWLMFRTLSEPAIRVPTKIGVA